MHRRASQERLYNIWACQLLVLANHIVFRCIVQAEADGVPVQVNGSLVSSVNCRPKLVRGYYAPQHKVGCPINPAMDSELPLRQLVVCCTTKPPVAHAYYVSNCGLGCDCISPEATPVT
jgi:hypothetical protein